MGSRLGFRRWRCLVKRDGSAGFVNLTRLGGACMQRILAMEGDAAIPTQVAGYHRGSHVWEYLGSAWGDMGTHDCAALACVRIRQVTCRNSQFVFVALLSVQLRSLLLLLISWHCLGPTGEYQGYSVLYGTYPCDARPTEFTVGADGTVTCFVFVSLVPCGPDSSDVSFYCNVPDHCYLVILVCDAAMFMSS